MSRIDRNQKAKAEFANARLRHQTAQVIGSGAVTVVDMHGKPVVPGSIVIYVPTPQVILWQVMDVKPDLRPGAPPGAVHVTITANLPIAVNAAFPIQNMLTIGQIEQKEDAGADAGSADDAENVDTNNDQQQQQAEDAAGRADFDHGQMEDRGRGLEGDAPAGSGAIHLTDHD